MVDIYLSYLIIWLIWWFFDEIFDELFAFYLIHQLTIIWVLFEGCLGKLAKEMELDAFCCHFEPYLTSCCICMAASLWYGLRCCFWAVVVIKISCEQMSFLSLFQLHSNFVLISLFNWKRYCHKRNCSLKALSACSDIQLKTNNHLSLEGAPVGKNSKSLTSASPLPALAHFQTWSFSAMSSATKKAHALSPWRKPSCILLWLTSGRLPSGRLTNHRISSVQGSCLSRPLQATRICWCKPLQACNSHLSKVCDSPQDHQSLLQQ